MKKTLGLIVVLVLAACLATPAFARHKHKKHHHKHHHQSGQSEPAGGR
jgi:hypothetical protein